MKRLYLKIVSLFLVFLIVGCKDDNKSYINIIEPKDQVILTEENLPPVEYFSLEKIDVADIIGERFFVYADSILISINTKRPDPYIVSFYNFLTREFLSGYIKRGNGPGEMINASIQLKNNDLYIEDCSKICITRINIDSVIEKKMLYSPEITYIQDGYTGVSAIYNNQDTITLINTWFINGFGARDIPEFVQIDAKTGNPLKKYKRNNSVYPYNACLRSLFFDSQSNKYIVPWVKFPVIGIYDNKFRLEKQYIGPEIIDIDLVADDKYGNIHEATNNTFYYRSPSQVDGKILLVNYRCKNKTYDEYKKNKPEIWIFDVSNGIERRLKCIHNHGELYCLSYCSATNNIYMMDFNDGELYKCVLEK